MKIRTSLMALAMALSVAPALAADLPSGKAPLTPPALSWSGFYAGVNVGGTIADGSAVNVVSGPLWAAPLAFAPDAPSFFAFASASGATGSVPTGAKGGFIGGGQIGYNYQFGAGGLGSTWVVGLETDFQGLAGSSGVGNAVTGVPLNGNIFFVNPAGVADALATSLYASKSLDYLGTLRGRVGALINPALLVYVTGGLAYGGASSSTSIAQFNNDSVNFGGFSVLNALAFGGGGYSATRVGWTAGAGLEWMFAPNWSAKFEYLYYDLGTVSYGLSPLLTGTSLPDPQIFAVASSRARMSFDGHIIRAGLNYHFSWAAPAAVLAKY